MPRHSPSTFPVAALIAIALAGAAVVLPWSPADAQSAQGFKSCGDGSLILIFKNPDLVVQPDGLIHATGWFFIQFQAIGDRALDITKLAFSFGKSIPAEAESCDVPAQTPLTGNSRTGAYIYKYRADDDPRDGFFVPINTTNVPDGEYAAAISAFKGDEELVRYYTKAVVENGCVLGGRTPPPPNGCNAVAQDKVKPWPIVLPGDGEQTRSQGGLTIEFAEQLAEEPKVYLKPKGGVEQRVPIALVPADQQPEYDDDTVPDNPYVPSAIQSRPWGPMYHWPGTIRTDDIIKVQAVDLAGNRVEKILHIGDPTIGGRIVLAYPDLEIAGSGEEQVADEFGHAVYPFTFKNVGNGTAHGNLIIDSLPEAIQAKFDKDHPIVGPGQTHFANLTVTALDELKPGTYDITGFARYQRASEEVTKTFGVKFTLATRTNNTRDQELLVKGNRPDETAKDDPLYASGTPPPPTAPTEETTSKGFLGVPGPGALAVGAAAAAALATTMRRNRR